MPQDQDSDGDRLRRPEPARTGPKRTGFATSAVGAQAGATAEGPPPSEAAPDSASQPASGPSAEPAGKSSGPGAARDERGIDEVIAHAVRLGYDVIGENLRQGRDAADRFSAGAYKTRHAKQDVEQIGRRLLHLGRDLGVTWFDLLGAVARDPKLEEVVRRRPPPEEPTPPPEDASSPVKVGCVVKGSSRASADPLLLARSERPSTLVIAGLHSPVPALPPLLGVTFLASGDGESIVAMIEVPEDQPPGVYSGVVCDGLSHAPLGTLTVKVSG